MCSWSPSVGTNSPAFSEEELEGRQNDLYDDSIASIL